MSLNTTSKHSLNTSRVGDSTTSLGSPFQCLTTLSVIFSIAQMESPLVQIKAIPFSRITSYMVEEAGPQLTTTSLQVVIESNKVSPEPPILQTEQSQLLLPLLIRPVLQTPHQLCCPPLDTLQGLDVFLPVRGSKLGTVLEVWPHQC